ncbi:hypothetical protein ALO_19642 [Acetonema longum DSM 6540]|uniref:Uncharacterized protein n=1 Tax=Acetonema longum DSM 6540 TaxID=1009370 RepID=F7NP85_9FIRM|nr:hypothetical protein ALO_19642 [Acetonema longum DSM 6540]
MTRAVVEQQPERKNGNRHIINREPFFLVRQEFELVFLIQILLRI